jgi:hypothetical protein
MTTSLPDTYHRYSDLDSRQIAIGAVYEQLGSVEFCPVRFFSHRKSSDKTIPYICRHFGVFTHFSVTTIARRY